MGKIAVKKFFYPPVFEPEDDTNLYESDLGFDQYEYDTAMALTPEEVLRYNLEIGFDIYFFYPATMCWYFIDVCGGPGIRLTKLRVRKNWDGKYIKGNSVLYFGPGDSPDVIFKADTIEEFIKGAKIDGKSIGKVLNKSYIDNFS